MYRPLGDARLKNDQHVEIGVITPPQPDRTQQLHHLLGHKGEEWVWQVDQSLAGNTDELENRFYVATDDAGRLVSNVCTFEVKGVGILGHVWTPLEERRKGLCTRIFEKLMDDFRSRGGGLMLLGTGFDTPPWHIYRRFGFVELFEGSGLMRYSTEDEFEAKYFAASETRLVDRSWSAWPRLNALAAEPEEYTKSLVWPRFFKNCFEDAYLWLIRAMNADDTIDAKLLESASTGAIVGYAWTVPGGGFPGVYLLDLYSHPNHPGGYAKLLDALEWPEDKITTFIEASLDAKASALQAAGFDCEGTLKNHLKKRDGAADVLVYSRQP